MQYNKDFKFSIFQSATLKKPIKTVTLTDWLNGIKSDQNKTQIEAIRNEPDPKKRKALKAKLLPAATLSGVFSYCNTAGLITHSGLLCLDFDHVKDLPGLKGQVKDLTFVIASFISPSGDGLKVLVVIDPANHAASFTALESYFKQHVGEDVDSSGKDVTRLCYTSHDPEIFYNPLAAASPFVLSIPPPKERKEDKTKEEAAFLPIPKDFTRQQQENQFHICLNKITFDIAPEREEWINKIVFPIANFWGEYGREYVHQISRYSTKYNAKDTDKNFDSALKGKGKTIAAFFGFCKGHGISWKDEKSPETQTKPVSFKNQHGEEITDRERIENSISEIYEIRHNIIMDKIECREKINKEAKWEAAYENDISRELEFKRVKNCSPQRIKTIINSKFVKKFNPFKYYFENLTKYDYRTEPDYIQNLANIVQLKDEMKDRERFNKHFKKALVRCVACSMADEGQNPHYNKHAVVFISPKQSIGKTGFIRFLMPKDLENYCVEKMIFGSRDEQFTMQSSFIINLDEMQSIDEKNLQTVKSAMSTGMINVRKINSGDRLIQPRRCSYWGNTNETQILKEDTGSVRWLCFEVDAFNRDKEYWKQTSPLHVDIDKVWGQAYTSFVNGFHFQLTDTELKENEAANEMYKEPTFEEELLMQTFTPGMKDKNNLKNTSEILSVIAAKYPFVAKNLNINKLGSTLRKNGFIRGKEYVKLLGYQIDGYYVQKL